MIYCFDLDGTLCTLTQNSQYESALPYKDVIEKVNLLYNEGHYIKIFTARGCVSGKDWTEQTARQLKEWGVSYHQLIMNSKPHFDLLIDDKVMNIKDWRKQNKLKIGFVASSFDLMHAGYIQMLKEAKDNCDYLICGIHSDPSIERSSKNSPVQSLEERIIVLSSIRYVDEVIVYDTEEQLVEILKDKKPHIRFLGTDYIEKSYTGQDLGIPIHFIDRSHGWSTTGLRERVWKAENIKRQGYK